MRRLIREFDGLVRRALGVVEFTDDPACLLRLRRTRLRHARILRDGVLQAGSPVLELHLWNEHIPAMPPAGPDAEWAARTVRRLRHSLGLLAYAVRTRPQLSITAAIGGPTTLLADQPSRALLERLGFQVLPGDPPAAFSAFFQDLYRATLVWAFNPPALRRRKSLRFHHDEIWMPKSVLIDRYERNALFPRLGNARLPGR